MKTKLSRIGKKSLSVIIVAMMVISTMVVGMVSVSAADSFTAGSTIYFNSGKASSWWKNKNNNNETATYIKFWKDGTSTYTWVKMNETGDGNYYSATVPSGTTYDRMKFVRAQTSLDTGNTWDTNNILNYTSDDLTPTAMGSNNCYTISSDSGVQLSGSWSTYTPSTSWKIFGGNYGGWTGSKGQDLTAVSGKSNLYSIELSSLSGYFAFYNGTSQCGPASNGASLPSSSASAATISSSNSGNAFNMSTAVSNVTVYLDDSSSSNIKVWYETSSTTATYYLTGRFGIKKDGNMTYLTGTEDGWESGYTSNIQFSQVNSSNDYKLETGLTIKELATKTGEKTWYFQISNGTNTKYCPDTDSDKALTVSDNNTEFGTRTSAGSFYFTGEDESGTVTLYFNSSSKKFHFEVESSTTAGAYKITDKTEVNGKLSFSADGKTAGTADEGDTVTVTVNPDTGFNCTGITVTGADKNTVESTGSGNTYTFTMPAQNVTVKATLTLDKAAYIATLGDGLWIDVAPSETDSTATLIKWNNYSGSNHGTSNPYTFYVPKNVDLTNVKIYNGFSSDVTLNGVSIPSKSCNTATLSLTANTEYTPSGATSSKIKVMKGSTNAMFLKTSTALPTKTNSSVTDAATASTYKDEVNYKGGSCKTMTYSTTAKFSSAMKLDSVKGRGNSSWEASARLFGKYAFNMKLSSKTGLFGMDSAKSWCLLANNADESMLRNALTYQLADEIGINDSPEFRFVDIYDNGEYMGSYLVTEKVDVGTSKLVKGESFDDINETAAGSVDENTQTGTYTYNDSTYEMKYAKVKSDGNTSAIPYDSQGKYLLEFEIGSRYTAESSYFTSPLGQHVVVKSPEFATKEQVEFIAKKFAEMEDIIFNETTNSSSSTSTATKAQLSTVMDVESFAKMYLIQEFSSNLDAASTSYYITYDCAQESPVFVANPVWDYDWAYGQYTNKSKKPVSGTVSETYLQTDDPNYWVAKYKSIDDSTGGSQYSIQSLLASKNSAFKAEIRKQWEATNGFYSTIQNYYKDGGQLDKWYNQIKDSVNMNETRWGFINDNNLSGWGSKDTGSTHSAAVTYLKTTWTAARASWLNTKFTDNANYTAYTPSAPTIKAYAADGTTETSEVSVGNTFVIKVTNPESGVLYRLYKDGTQVGSDQSASSFAITTDDSMANTTLTYTVKAVFAGRESDASTSVSVSVTQPEGVKTVRIYFKSASATVYVPSLSVDGGTATVMTRIKKGETGSTYFGTTYSGSISFYWFYSDITIDTANTHSLTFTTKNYRVNATKSDYTFTTANNYYFAVDNLMNGTEAVDLTDKAEYIRNYHISATHMVYSSSADGSMGFTYVDGTEYAMGTYLSDNSIDSPNGITSLSTNLLALPNALTPGTILKANSAVDSFTIRSATLAQLITAGIREVSTLQYQLLDVNLDGVVDINDATMMQKALAGIE